LDEPIDLDEESFDELVRDARVPVLIDFWAEWCGPCRAVSPTVKATAKAMRGRALVVKVNTDQNQSLAARFGVRGIPFFVVMKDGELKTQQAGAVDSSTMKGWLEQAGA